jgi:recombination protein RecT
MTENLPAQAIKSVGPRFEETVRGLGWRMKFEAEARFLMQHIEKPDSRLNECDPRSFGEVMLTVASIGVSLNPALAHAYIVPYAKRATLVIGYRGLVDLALEEGAIQWIQGHVVREGDEFDYEYGLEPFLKHKPKGEGKGRITAAYCVWKAADGTKLFDVMTADDLQKVRSSSKAANSPAWTKWSDQMSIKAVIRRASKLWKKSERFARVIEHDEREFEDAEVVGDTISTEQLEALEALIPAGQTGAALRARIGVAYDISALADLPAESYDTVVEMLKAATQQRRKA